MWNQVLNIMINCCNAAYQWFTQLIGGMTQNGSGPWGTIFGILMSMLALRFVFYPFLKGRVVGGVGEEISRYGNRASTHFTYDNTDHYNSVGKS